VSTIVSVNTYTYAVTYVTGQMLHSLRRIIEKSGLDPGNFIDNWESIEVAVSTWLQSEHLKKVFLEIYDPKTDAFVSGWDFAVDYGYGSNGDGTMWADTDAIFFAIIKCGILPSTCKYKILVELKPGSPDVTGWGPATYRSRDGFVHQAVGTTIGTHGIGAQAGYWRKK
jgi:hypothetical protein